MQHKHYNTRLNNLKEDSDKPGAHSSPIAYTHSHLVDSFYTPENVRDREKVRVTRNEKTGEVLATVKKVRLGNLDVYSPKRAADWRISVNVEVPGAYTYPCGALDTSQHSFQYRIPWVHRRTHVGRTVSATPMKSLS